MRKIFLLIVFFTVSLLGFSDELIVKDFTKATTDLTGTINLELDSNDEPCALIIVYLDAENVSFSGSTIVKSFMKNTGEYWVYLAAKSKRFSINAIGYTPLLDFTFNSYGIKYLEGKTTYKMVIETPSKKEKRPIRTMQYLEFHVAPIGINATIQIKGESEPHYVDPDGLYTSTRVFGTYTYTVSAADYYSQTNAVVVNDPNNKTVVEVTLVPSYGFLKLSSAKEYDEATVSIDGKVYGVLPLEKIRLPKGSHNVSISKAQYATQREIINIRDNEAITTMAVKMDARFVTTTISSADKDAELWIDNRKVGKGEATVDIGFGNHVLYAKKDKHKDVIVELKDINAKSGRFVSLPAPEPIIGTFNITSNPQGATIKVDNQEIGTSPILYDCLVGSHIIEIEKTGYQKDYKLVDIKEGETIPVDFILSDVFDIEFTANVAEAELFIDGKPYGIIPTAVKLQSGEHNVTVKKAGYLPYEKTILTERCEGGVNVQMQSEIMEVYFYSNPENALLYIDGKIQGTLPMTLRLSSDKHRISAYASGYKDYTKNIVASELTDSKFYVSMQQESQAKKNIQDWDDTVGKIKIYWLGVGAVLGTTIGAEVSAFDMRFGLIELRPCVWSFEGFLSPATTLSHNTTYDGVKLEPKVSIRNEDQSYYSLPYEIYSLRRSRTAYSPKFIINIPIKSHRSNYSLYLGGGPLFSWTTIKWIYNDEQKSTAEGSIYDETPWNVWKTRYFDSIWFTIETGFNMNIGRSEILYSLKYQDGIMVGILWRIGTTF